tara:strand:+ start:51 stop:1271 length:1221 start_codon:yes stop_codon:yes gene_type:complete
MENEFYEHRAALVADLIPYAMNSRDHSDDQIAQLAASIREFGFTNPIIIDEKNNLIAGHGRLLAARKLKMDRVPAVVVTGFDDRKRRALVIADNKLALNATWNIEALLTEVKDLGEEFGELMGFSEDELIEMLKGEDTEGLTDEDAVPEAPEVPITVEGDVWVLGRHRLMCGDSTSIDAVEKLMGGSKADQMVTDPPYNVDYEGSDGQKIQNDSMSDEIFRQFLSDAFVSAFSVMKEGASFYIWHADLEGYNFRGAVIDSGQSIRSCLIWNKPSIVMGRSDYHWKHEPCLYGWKSGAAHLWSADRKQSTVIDFIAKPKKNDLHPTMKPVELMEYLILNNTKGQDIVLDIFGGSGSTLIASEKTGRNCCMMELDKKYCDVIIKRWQEFTGQEATHEESGKTYVEMTK